MTLLSVTPSEVRTALLLREEIALLDLRHEAAFATGHPLFAANMAAGRIALEAEARLPRKDVPIVLYDDGEGLVPLRRSACSAGLRQCPPARGRAARPGKHAGYELFQDVNSYAKAFGELVEHRRHTPSLPADEVAALIASGANIADPRRPPFRRIRDHEHSGLGQRARRGAGAARRPRRAGSARRPSSSIAPAAPARSSARSR